MWISKFPYSRLLHIWDYERLALISEMKRRKKQKKRTKMTKKRRKKIKMQVMKEVMRQLSSSVAVRWGVTEGYDYQN